ncbi:GAF and ANTAR domain-containing protein [Rhodococcus triatomae]|nr:GAF and ANTAR domain-containing protein [Rhodococcus triatomae]QNG20225.1 GAF and ANTAR domain-containing protein [Rhodococcus triatomae]QNG23860.1 GAF and ANTAR domain-containing protein [Rhodococcus triatomae]
MDGTKQVEDSVPVIGTESAIDPLVTGADSRLDAITLGKLLVALGQSIDDEDGLIVLLQRVVESATQTIVGADSAGVTIALGGRVYTAVHTDERTLAVDEQQYEADEGPCLHAARTGEVTLVDVDGAEQRWPEFALAARAEGIHSFLAAPLRAGESFGALNLYGRGPAAFDAIDAQIIDILTSSASSAIGDFSRYQSAVEVADKIRAAIAHRAPVEQAKGILMSSLGIDADAAFFVLRRQSQSTNRKLREIAAEIVDNAARRSPR